jgi:hypothetical protein
MLEQEVSTFLQSYGDAFNRVDVDAIARMYHLPCMTIRGDGSIREFHEADEVREFMGVVAQTYYDEGNRVCSFDSLVVVPIGGECALATLRRILRDEDSALLRDWRQSYNLIRTQDGWNFLLSTFHR